jgi:PIN domain nuclease of toxin-antitoxin system
MRYFLDTCTWIWLQNNPERLSQSTLTLLGEAKNELFLSVASVWEISIKSFAGNLRPPVPLEDLGKYMVDRLQMQSITAMAISVSHAVRAASLPMHHKDPFDRMIIAQAELEKATIVTNDDKFSQYEIPILWAG